MTILAGAWRPDRAPIDGEITRALRSALSRHPEDAPSVHEVPGCFLGKVDIGAFGEPAMVRDAGGGATLLAGEPLLDSRNGSLWRSRSADTERLHHAIRHDEWDVLTTAAGAYCLAHYDPTRHRLCLVTDQLGVRPLYRAQIGSCVVFASALRILEAIPGADLRIDPRGILEQAYLQAPLEGRTIYRGVRLLGPAEVLEDSPDGSASRIVRRWDAVAPRFGSEDEALDALHASFQRAVARRRRNDRAAAAFLSGGLDSRVIVASLRAAGMQVRTLNFSLEGSLDHTLGKLFADAIGTEHESHPYQAGIDDVYIQMAAEALQAERTVRPERPALIWTGFGGSGIVGQANTRPHYAELCRNGQLEAAVNALFDAKGGHVPARLFRPPYSGQLRVATEEGVLGVFRRLTPVDPGRLIELFFLLNPGRSQLHADHEATDLIRLEQQTPFFDADVVETTLAIPYEWLAGHRLYHRWLDRFGPPTNSVPWQTYPGNEPCPIPVPSGPLPQWEIARGRRFRRKALVKVTRQLVFRRLPSLLDRWYLAAVGTLHLLGVRNYAYALRLAKKYVDVWERTGRAPVPTESEP